MKTCLKCILRVLFPVVVVFNGFGQAHQLSDKAYISLLTASPGKALYEAFGHSALRVYDPVLQIDRAYNYGTFDFDQPHFYANFAKGNLNYMLSVEHGQRFINYYIYFNRSVYEDILNLNQREKQELYEMLEINSLPENKTYSYDYFYNNCATKIRDVVEKVLKGKLIFDGSHITTTYSIRELIDLYIGPQPWGDLAIDFALGTPIDKIATPYEYMYLPDYLQLGFLKAHIERTDTTVPLVKHSVMINEALPEEKEAMILTPLLIFWFLFFITLSATIWDFKRGKLSVGLDLILFGVIGTFGVVLAFISFFTNHEAAANNFNLLWAFPLHLPAALLLVFRKKLPVINNYFLISTVFICIVLIGSFTFIPQKIHYAIYPVILALGIRSFFDLLPRQKNEE